MTMQKAVILGKRQAGLADIPIPRPKEDWVLVKVHVAPMCTEYKPFVSGQPSYFLGHEAAGEVVDIAQPGKVAVADRVVVMPQYPCGKCALCLAGDYIYCQDTVNFAEFTGSQEGRATMAQYLLKPDWLLVPIPQDMSYEHASMACCGLGPTFGAMEEIRVDAFDTVLITGLGPVGLGGVINGRYRGARVIGVDGNSWRAERARALGAEVVINPGDVDALDQIMRLTGGKGVDKAIDCSGVVAAHRLCIDSTRRRGSVAFVGESGADTPVRISPDLIRKGLRLAGSWHYNLKDTARIMEVIACSSSDLDLLISHHFALADVQKAWELQASGQCAKVLLHPWE
ncbi:MAG: zinc-binding dehydrogenase [Anaerolineae bacterium]|nr:zinc-binding dehydrogenase [Anaerolineae bacterium]